MNYLAPLIGAVIGLLMTRHWLGALVGAALGWLGGQGWLGLDPRRAPRSAQAPLTAMFALLGRLAKADGRVGGEEIAVCERLMQRLGLDERARRAAVEAFQDGKRADFDLAPAYAELRQSRRHAPLFLDVFVEMALADGRIDAEERRLLGKYAWMLGVRESALEALLDARLRQKRGGAGNGVRDPYAVLGIGQQAGQAEVRRAFRKLMSQHHPDKLAARGASPEMVKLAQERTQEIIAAYEQIKSARGMS